MSVQELAFTLADGFYYIEMGINAGLNIDDFAPRMSFFFNSSINFCAFNVIPELYRDSTQRKYSIPANVYEQKTGFDLKRDKYFRKYTVEEKKRIISFYERSLGRNLTSKEIGLDLDKDEIPMISSVNPDQ